MVACLPAAREPRLKTFAENSIELPSYSFNSLLFRSHSPCLADSRADVSEVTAVEAVVKVTADGSSRVRVCVACRRRVREGKGYESSQFRFKRVSRMSQIVPPIPKS